MFSCVWLYFKKFSEKYFLVFGKCYKEKTNSENTDKTQIDTRRSTGFDGAVLRELQSDNRAVDRDLTKHRAASRAPVRQPRCRSRSREVSIVISQSTAPIAIGAKARSRSRIAIDGASACEWHGLELGACERRGLVRACFSLALSLSLSGIHLK